MMPSLPMPSLQQIPALLRQLADPRGRCNRQGFLNTAVAFLALQVGVWALLKLAGIDLSETQSFILNAPILWIGTAVCVKRLHDLGRKGWLIPAAIAGWIVAAIAVAFIAALVFGPEALLPGSAVYAGVFTIIVVPALASLIWLHTATGMMTENAFGPVPAEFGLSMPAGLDADGFDATAIPA